MGRSRLATCRLLLLRIQVLQTACPGRYPCRQPQYSVSCVARHHGNASLCHPQDLARAGRRKCLCPYYGARRALPEADVVLAPYSAVLQEEAREALGIKLEVGCVPLKA